MARREKYFTTETIDERSARFLRDPEVIRREDPPGFDPRVSALLVLDLQRYFLEEESHAFVPSAAAILPRVRALTDVWIGGGRPCVFTRHENTRENAGRMAEWWRDLVGPGDPRGELAKEIGADRGRVVVKGRYDAFHGTELEETLRKEGVEQVVICGVLAHLCCESTARSAFIRDFRVFFVVDGVADYNAAFHRASLLNLSHGFARPVLAGDLLAEWEALHDG